jgi:hypothetical protein
VTTLSTLELLGLTHADAAIHRAAEQARRIAAQSGTPLAVWQDGRVVLIPATSEGTTPVQQPNIIVK